MKFSKDLAVEVLSSTPQTLQSILLNVDEKWYGQNEGGDSWTPKEIVAHLILGEKTDWIPRLELMLNKAPESFPPFDMHSHLEYCNHHSLKLLLLEFKDLRGQNLDRLKKMSIMDHQLDWKGLHPDLGEVNVRHHLSSWVVHDLSHIAQIARTMAKQYYEEVGPWIKYLPILKR